MVLKNLNTTLNNIGEVMVEIFKVEAKAKGMSSTGDLVNSIEYKVDINPAVASIGIYAIDYYKYVLFGRKAGYPSGGDGEFLRRLIVWVKKVGIESEEKKVKSAAWAIRESIFRNGIAPVDLIGNAEKEINKIVGDELEESINKDVQEFFDKIIRV